MKFLKGNRLGLSILILVLVFILVADKSMLIHRSRLFAESIEQKIELGKDINILVLGIDARPGEMTARSDTMILVSIHPAIQKAALIWIPRDTRLNTPTKGSYKINSVNFYKGPEKACDVVGDLLGVDVEYYVAVNFNGFEKIIDQLGGIDLDVDINLYSPSSNVHLSKGRQHLNGKEALKYVRFRSTPSADIGRTERQQKLIAALLEHISHPAVMMKIPVLFPDLIKNVDTNIPFKSMLALWQMKFLLNSNNTYSQTLPGYDDNTGECYWIVDPQVANSVIDSVLEGHRYEVQEKPWNY